jgi:spermidine synthase
MPAIFFFFFLSGLCSILYEIIWLRLAMASFGVTTALTSIVLSTFMAGIGLGSWQAGVLLRKYGDRIPSPLLVYAALELGIGIGGIVVPYELAWGRVLIEGAALPSSPAYYVASGAWIALAIVPWSALMGATIPTAMMAIQRRYPGTPRTFSYLYLANVLGAVAGTVAPLLLVELYGFRRTLWVGAALNVLIAVAAGIQSGKGVPARVPQIPSPGASLSPAPLTTSLLFLTGLATMGLEIVWIRQFTPYLGSVVYAFAGILSLYLACTFLGSQIYRLVRNAERVDGPLLWLLLAACALIPLFTADPQIPLPRLVRLFIGITPFSALVGFLTPMLVDRWSGGDADRAGRAYAINVLGCIAGPLLAGFMLLPFMSERWVSGLLAAPWILVAASRSPRRPQRWLISAAGAAALLAIVSLTRGYETQFGAAVILRDHTATTIATGEGFERRLLVNGIGMTGLSSVTKTMAHLPLAFLEGEPTSALVICFGMGTTHRSLLSWGIASTAVELVPSVPKLFGYYHADGAALAASPLSRIVVDDGRRFLERTSEEFDVITIDPPPPAEAAGSSLLLSIDFYRIAKRRLRPGGILQQWFFTGDPVMRGAIVRGLQASFAHVRAFPITQNSREFVHFIASDRPIPGRSAAELADRLPARAVEDLLEWSEERTAPAEFARILSLEVPLEQVIADAPEGPPLTDDRPVNEYFILRRLAAGTTLGALIPQP